MERELSQLRQALNFSDFTKLRAQTEYESWLRKSGQSRTWHKVKEIIDRVQGTTALKVNSTLVLSNMSSPVVHLRCLCPGVDWYLIQEWSQDEKPTWLNKKFPRRCLSGQLIVENNCYWNNGRIWESGMTEFYIDLLKSMNWQPDLIVCDMSCHISDGDNGDNISINNSNNDDNQEQDNQESNQLQIKLAEMKLALSCLKMSGSMVIKLLGVSNSDTRHLVIESLQSCFNNIELIKLQGSNPLNSELYLFCHGLHSRQPTLSPSSSSSTSSTNTNVGDKYKLVENMCIPHIKKQISEIQKFLYFCGQILAGNQQIQSQAQSQIQSNHSPSLLSSHSSLSSLSSMSAATSVSASTSAS